MSFVSRLARYGRCVGINRAPKLLVEQLEDRALPSIFLNEPNGTLATAFDTGIHGQETEKTFFVAEGRLGDDGDFFQNDHDYLKLSLQGGTRIGVGASFLGGSINSFGLVDSAGEVVETERSLADDPRIPFPDAAGRRSFLHWTVQNSGTYYIDVIQTATEDDYVLEIAVVPRVPLGPPILGDFGAIPSEPNDTIDSASVINVNGGILNGYYQSGLLGDNPHLGQDAPFGNLGRDVDLYKLVIPADFLPDVFGHSRVRIDVNTITTSFQDGVFFPQRMPEIDNLFLDLPSLRMRVFDEGGSEITGQLDLFLNGSVTSGLNLAATFPVPDIDTTYYLGIDLGHDYDPTIERSEPAILAAYDHEIPYVINVLRLPPIIDPGVPDIDIAVRSAAFQSGNTVQFTYETQSDPGPFDVGLYPSVDGISYDPAELIGNSLTITPDPNAGTGVGVLALPGSWTPSPVKPYLIAVAQPGIGIIEADSANNIVAVEPDIEAVSLQWNTTQGGVEAAYSIHGSATTEDTPVTLCWASGPLYANRLSKIAGTDFTIPRGASTQVNSYSQHVAGALLRGAPVGTTHLLVVVGDPDDASFNAQRQVKALRDVLVQPPSIAPFPVSGATIETLRGLLRESGQGDRKAIITSSVRTPLRQATAMYNNLENGTGRNYAAAGREVIRVYDRYKALRKSRAFIIAKMTEKIIQVGPYKVSHHCADAAQWAALQVIDVAPSSIRNKTLFASIARQAKDRGALSAFLDPTKDDPAFHLEIPQV